MADCACPTSIQLLGYPKSKIFAGRMTRYACCSFQLAKHTLQPTIFHQVRYHLRFRVCLQTLPPSYTLANVIYQANLVTQETCGHCCDGYHVCDAGSVCRPTSGPHAVCVPATATKTNMCGTSVDTAQQVACEICGAPSPAAKLFEEKHTTSRRLLQTGSREVGSRWHH